MSADLEQQVLEQAVIDLIKENDLVELTSALVAAAGENPGSTEEATVEVLKDFCLAAGLTVSTELVAPGRPNFTAILPGGSQPGLLFLGHSDVVPAGTGWKHPPFEPYVQDGRLFGRGSTDMKGGLAAVLIALKALKEAGAGLSGDAALVCTVDEEDLGIGIRAYTAAALKDSSFSYSGCVVAEPTDLETVIGCRGDSFIEVEVAGRSAHAGRPADGRNAISAAVKILELIRDDHSQLQAEQDPLLGAGSWNVGLIQGGTGTSMVADKCILSLDRRFLPDEDPEVILGMLQTRISEAGIDTDGISVKSRVTMKLPGFRTDIDHPLVANSVAALADAGISSNITGWTASCDGGFIATDLGVASIVMGPGGVHDQAHQVNESVSIAELLAAARAYALMCLRHI